MIKWPDNKQFAFTIFDDCDRQQLDKIKPIYDFLSDVGLRTTKSVWVLNKNSNESNQDPIIGIGDTCENSDYRNFALKLQNDGFEIGLHNVCYTSAKRDTIRVGIQRFIHIFGDYPIAMANHNSNLDNMYWGYARINNFLNRKFYMLLTKNKYKNDSFGHNESNDYFWGDICFEKIKYMRNFVFNDINTLKACPQMPYHDGRKPFVKYWFASSNGANVRFFNSCIAEKNQDRLIGENGACIMYTHFAAGFYDNEVKSLNRRFKSLIGRIASKNGWFCTVSELLDYLLSMKIDNEIDSKNLNAIERKWVFDQMAGRLRAKFSLIT